MTAESFLSIVVFFLSDDCEVGALQARLAYAHVLKAMRVWGENYKQQLGALLPRA